MAPQLRASVLSADMAICYPFIKRLGNDFEVPELKLAQLEQSQLPDFPPITALPFITMFS
jgi:hypothetical protein